MFPFATKRFIVKMVTRYRTLNFPRIKQWLMHGSGQFEEMLVAIFRSQKTAESARDTLKTVITKQPLLKRENLIMTLFRLFLYGRKARPRNESRLIRVKPAKSLQNAQKRKVTKN